MNHKVGIWIDHRKAVIVSSSPERLTSMTLESEVGQHLDRYYDEVISQLGQPDALVIFGPDEAKLQLKERLSCSKLLSACIVGIETTDTLTDPQIVAKVRMHYGIVPPDGSAARAGVNRGRTQ